MAVDPHSDTWRSIKSWVETERERIGRQIMASGTSVAETEYLRGQDRALRELMSLASDPSKAGEP